MTQFCLTTYNFPSALQENRIRKEMRVSTIANYGQNIFISSECLAGGFFFAVRTEVWSGLTVG